MNQGNGPEETPRTETPRGREKRERTRDLPREDRVVVSDDALATLIGLAAHEVPGVVGMAPAGLGEGLRRILGVSQANEGVRIQRDDGAAERAVLDLYVVVAYGVNIPVVAQSIRERVQHAAGTYAGVTVDNVRVHVAGVSRG